MDKLKNFIREHWLPLLFIIILIVYYFYKRNQDNKSVEANQLQPAKYLTTESNTNNSQQNIPSSDITQESDNLKQANIISSANLYEWALGSKQPKNAMDNQTKKPLRIEPPTLIQYTDEVCLEVEVFVQCIKAPCPTIKLHKCFLKLKDSPYWIDKATTAIIKPY